MNIAVVDCETTHYKIACAEMLTAHVIILSEGLDPIREKSFSFRPFAWREEHEDAVAIHGITKEVALTFPEKKKEIVSLLDFVGEPTIFCCHANRRSGKAGGALVTFDYAMMKQECLDAGILYSFYSIFPTDKIISTHSLCVSLGVSGSKEGRASHSLDSISKLLGIELKHHDAKSDAWACANILLHCSKHGDIFELAEKDWENVSERSFVAREKKRAKSEPDARGESTWIQSRSGSPATV